MNEQDITQCSRHIEHNFNLQIDQVSSYIQYLSDIKTAISKNDTPKLTELLESQQLKPEVIEQTQNQQAKILTQYGFEVSKNGLNNCIQNCNNSTQLEDLHEKLIQKLAELEKALIVNALLVKKGQLRVKQSIRILSGHNSSNAVSGYTRQGGVDNNEENKHSLALA